MLTDLGDILYGLTPYDRQRVMNTLDIVESAPRNRGLKRRRSPVIVPQVAAAALNETLSTASKTSDQSIPASTWTALTWDTVSTEIATVSGHPERLSLTRVTWYAIIGTIVWDISSTGYRGIRIRPNGLSGFGIPVIIGPPASGSVTIQGVSAFLQGAPAGYFEVDVFQNSGGALNAKWFASLADSVGVATGVDALRWF